MADIKASASGAEFPSHGGTLTKGPSFGLRRGELYSNDGTFQAQVRGTAVETTLAVKDLDLLNVHMHTYARSP